MMSRAVTLFVHCVQVSVPWNKICFSVPCLCFDVLSYYLCAPMISPMTQIRVVSAKNLYHFHIFTRKLWQLWTGGTDFIGNWEHLSPSRITFQKNLCSADRKKLHFGIGRGWVSPLFVSKKLVFCQKKKHSVFLTILLKKLIILIQFFFWAAESLAALQSTIKQRK